MSIRPVKSIVQSKPTLEGAGVQLRRAFGFGETSEFDPFLLFDDFRNDNPDDYHRRLSVASAPRHRDHHLRARRRRWSTATASATAASMGAGDVQWMTAGRGILHQEMPKGDAQGRMHGFQLWANLPSSLKMTAPRYQDIPAAAIPEVVDDDGTRVRVDHRRVLGQARPGGRRRGRAALSRRLGAARQEEDAARWTPTPTPSPMCSRARARSAARRRRSAC